mmetsp:Transcript_72159/g.203897  ORF Transcript_72159/g.203897 Transcript_72159/m.203897 type:complete len:208 (-) Transcript_72159:466-1089(-)
MFCRSRFCTSTILSVALTALAASRFFSATSDASSRCRRCCSSTSSGTAPLAAQALMSWSETEPRTTLLSARMSSRTRTLSCSCASCTTESTPAARNSGACLERKRWIASSVLSVLECCASSATSSSSSPCAASDTRKRLKLAVDLMARSRVVITKPPCCAEAVWSRYSFGTLRSDEVLLTWYRVAFTVLCSSRHRNLLLSFSVAPTP